MLVRVLGPVEVFADGGPLPIPGAIPVRLLALLAVSPGVESSTGVLIDAIWGDQASSAAQATLQSHVARLRRVLGATAIETTRAGYRLGLPPTAIDSHQFETAVGRGARLLASGRAAEAADTLAEALGLWRGPAYRGEEDCAPLAREAARLDALRFDAHLLRARADLARGAHAGLAPELTTLADAHPTNEVVSHLLMSALYAAGRAADALAAYQRTASALRDELGLDPGPELRELQLKILRQTGGDGPRGGTPDGQAQRTERRAVSIIAVRSGAAAGAAHDGGEDDPELEAARRSRLLDVVRGEVERVGGQVSSTVGGLALAVFGAQATREDDAVRACRSAQRIASQGGFAVGVASGLAVVGGRGPGALTETGGETVPAGAVADRAASLCATAVHGSALADQATHAACGAELSVGLGVGSVVSFSRHGSAWEVVVGEPLAQQDQSAPAAVGAGAGRVPMVGRDAELGQLLRVVADTRARGRAVVIPVIGEAGLGKTRLVVALREAIAVQTPGGPPAWSQAQCDSLGERSALAPVADLVPVADHPPPELVPSRAEAIAHWSAALAATANNGLHVACIEDLHWGSELLLDLVDAIAASPPRSPLVVLVTARPEIETRRPGWLASAPSVHLRTLDDADIEALVGVLLDPAAATSDQRKVVAESSGGVPLFAVEFGRMLASEDASELRLPTRLSDLMAARIDTLDGAARELLTDASVVGSTFWAGAVDAIADRPGDALREAATRTLLGREFIRAVHPSSVEGDREFRFSHDLLRDAAYGRLVRADRAVRHLRAAQWWRGLGRASDLSVVAEHAWLASELATAAEVKAIAAQAHPVALATSLAAGAAARGYDGAAAVTFSSRAAHLARDTPDEPAALLQHAWALCEHRDLDAAELVVDRALELLSEPDLDRLDAILLRSQLDFSLGKPSEGSWALMTDLARQVPTGPIHVQAVSYLAVLEVIQQSQESFRRAVELADGAIAQAAAEGIDDAATVAYAARGRARLALGDPSGMADMDRAQASGYSSGHTILTPFMTLGTRQWYAGAAHHWSGPHAELQLRLELEAHAERTGLEFLVSYGIAERLRCLWELGRHEECVIEADRIDRRSDAMTRWVVVQRALALADLGRLDSETVALVEATPPADDGDLRHVIGSVLVRVAAARADGDATAARSVLLGLGDLRPYAARDGALEFLPRVVRESRSLEIEGFGRELQDMALEPTPLGRAITATLAGLLATDPESRVAHLRRAVAGWSELGESVDLERAQADLEDAERVLAGVRD